MNLRPVKIRGTGSYHPPRKVSNLDLEKIMDTSDEWIQQRSGIISRYHADENTSTSDLAYQAAVNSLESSNLQPNDIDLIITATLSPDHFFPGIGVQVQSNLGLITTPSMDIRNQCSGFIYALNTAYLFVSSGQYNRVMVIGAELHSKLINLSTKGRDIAVLFGDGAGAVILEPSDCHDSEILSFSLHSQGEHYNKLWLERPGTSAKNFIEADDIANGKHYPHMEGRQVFKHATRRLQETVCKLIEKENLQIEDIDHFLFHQANLRINEAVATKLQIPETKVHNNIQEFGNCSAASLPILLDEQVKHGTVKRGDILCMAAFGAGFTWGGALLKW